MDPFHPTYEMRVASQPIKTAGVGGFCPEINGKLFHYSFVILINIIESESMTVKIRFSASEKLD